MLTILKSTEFAQPPRVKVCKDCRHFVRKSGPALCSKVAYIDLVYGQEVPISAFEARKNVDICGPGAVHWEPEGKKTIEEPNLRQPYAF
jgi:hypothetical protein